MFAWLPSSSWEVTMFWPTLSLFRTSPRVGVDSSHGSLSATPPPVSGNDRPVCYLSKSPLLYLFLFLLRSSSDGDGRSSTVLGPPPGLSISSLDLVSGSAGPSNRPAGNFASSTGSPQPASLSASSSRAPQASSSCLRLSSDLPGCGILLPISCSGWLGLAFFLSHHLLAKVICVSQVVQVSGPLSFSALAS